MKCIIMKEVKGVKENRREDIGRYSVLVQKFRMAKEKKCMYKEREKEFSIKEKEKLDLFKKKCKNYIQQNEKIELLEEYHLVTTKEIEEFRKRKEECNKIIGKHSTNSRVILTGKDIGQFPYWKLGNRLCMRERTIFRKIREAKQKLLLYL